MEENGGVGLPRIGVGAPGYASLTSGPSLGATLLVL